MSYEKGTVASNVSKEPYQLKISLTFIWLEEKQTGLYEKAKKKKKKAFRN